MSLRKFHVLFISLATLMALGTGFFFFLMDARQTQGRHMGLGFLFLASGAALVAYGIWFLQKIRSMDVHDS